MIYLGVDSSAKTASVGIVSDNKVIVDFTLNHKRTHSEKLLEMIDMSLKIAQIDIADVDAFCVTKGPGSFTGLRIGLATVKGLCHSLGKPCYLVSTIDSLYENVKNSYSEDIIFAPIMDARRNEVYCGAFKGGKKIIEDSALSIKDFINMLLTFDFKKVVFTGDGVLPNKEIILNTLKDRADFAPEQLSYGSGASVIFSALNYGEKVDYNNILPEYLRLSQAERLRKEQ